jgi:hypothetical protein
VRSAVIAVRSMPPAAGRCVLSRLFGISDGMGGTARSPDGNGMGGVVPSEDESGRGIVVTGSGLDAADSGMVPSLSQVRPGLAVAAADVRCLILGYAGTRKLANFFQNSTTC